jgi:hypothetical protein
MTRQFESKGYFIKPWNPNGIITWRQAYASYRSRRGVPQYYYKSKTEINELYSGRVDEDLVHEKINDSSFWSRSKKWMKNPSDSQSAIGAGATVVLVLAAVLLCLLIGGLAWYSYLKK